MTRVRLLRWAVFAVIVCFQFTVYPGHTWLAGASQIFVPQFEHLDAPAFLTRDLVAIHANLTFTVFDEVSLFLYRTLHLHWQSALAVQQIASRMAGLCGIILLCTSLGIEGWWAMLVAGAAGFIGQLPGLALSPFGLEAAPYTLAFGFVLLAAGLLATGKPLVSGTAAGITLLYDPRIAAPFWIILLVALAADPSWRRTIRPMLPVLAVFALLLANFAQLQPASLDARGVFRRLPAAVEAIQRLRTPQVWMGTWPLRDLLFYTVVYAVIGWSVVACWRVLSRPLRWILIGLPAAGLLAIAFELISAKVHVSAVPLLHPNRTLLFAVLPGLLLPVLAAARASRLNRWLFLSAPLLLLAGSASPLGRPHPASETITAANWARDNTWGASMFVFPDAGQSGAAGAFRAQSLRPVWVDWQTGTLSDSSDDFAVTWQQRWETTMGVHYSRAELARLLDLPVDYIVLSPEHAIQQVKPVYADSYWLIYDAMDLRRIPKSYWRVPVS